MGNVVSIPATKMDHVTDEEKAEFEASRNGEDNLYHAGITEVDNAYDPTAGSKYDKIPVPSRETGPVLATDEGQPKVEDAKVLTREQNKAVDKSEQGVVRSSGRKANIAKTEENAK